MDEVVAELQEDALEPVLGMSDDELLAEVVCSVLAGRSNSAEIAEHLNLPLEKKRIKALLGSAAGQRALFKAKRDITATITDRIKRRIPVFVEQMEKLALDGGDARTQFAALKDLMDRGGIAATQKLAISSPEAYKRAIADLLDDDVGERLEMED